MDLDTLVTVGHKMQPFLGESQYIQCWSRVTCHVSRVTCHVSRVTCPDRPGDLVVHLGDWDLRYDYSNKYEAGEEFPHIEVRHSEL